MPPDLIAHLRAAMAEPFARPHMDCCSFAADWVLKATGIDPAADLRGAYSDLRGALRVIRSCGGFEAMWRARMASAGFALTSSPVVGDVGIVCGITGEIVSAIRVPGAWAGKAARGVTIEDVPMLCAWSLARG